MIFNTKHLPPSGNTRPSPARVQTGFLPHPSAPGPQSLKAHGQAAPIPPPEEHRPAQHSLGTSSAYRLTHLLCRAARPHLSHSGKPSPSFCFCRKGRSNQRPLGIHPLGSPSLVKLEARPRRCVRVSEQHQQLRRPWTACGYTGNEPLGLFIALSRRRKKA